MKQIDYLYPLRVIRQITRLPKVAHQNKQDRIRIEKDIEEIKNEISRINELIGPYTIGYKQITNLVHNIDEKVSNVKQSISKIQKKSVLNQRSEVNKTVSDNHNLDRFYKLFEDRFRGPEGVIKQRQSQYKPLFKSLNKEIRQLPIIDLGCGRGEFLSLLKEIGLMAVGVDMNHEMVKRAKKQGYEVYEVDAKSYISKQKNKSTSAITGFHLVEHIPFDLLIELFEECYRVLAPGGFVLFETPNPENLTVGGCNFYIDPSHIKPLPPKLLMFALESIGFSVEFIPLHPSRENIEDDDKIIEDIMNMLYGPQDYAVIGRKL